MKLLNRMASKHYLFAKVIAPQCKKSQFLTSNKVPYICNQVRNNKKTAILALLEPSASNKKKDKGARMYIICRPNTGLQIKQECYSDLKKKYKKCTCDEAQEHWEEQFKASSQTCSHAYW